MSESSSRCACCNNQLSAWISASTKNGSVRICHDCYENRYCQVCGKLDHYNNQKFEKIGRHNICADCIKKHTDKIGKTLRNFIQYLNRFYSKRHLESISNVFKTDNYIKNNGNIVESINSLINYGPNEDIEDWTCFKIFLDAVGKDFDEINVLKAHWNDYIVNELKHSKCEDFFVPSGCKRCGKDIKLFYYDYKPENKGFYAEYVDTRYKFSSAFELYTKVKNDKHFKCGRCHIWIDILDQLRQKFGWNPTWKIALDEFEEFGIRTHGQADPIDFYKILNKNGIVMSQQVIDVWNGIFDKKHGVGIIKCHSVPDSLTGEVQQHIGRATGNIISGLRKLFG